MKRPVSFVGKLQQEAKTGRKIYIPKNAARYADLEIKDEVKVKLPEFEDRSFDAEIRREGKGGYKIYVKQVNLLDSGLDVGDLIQVEISEP